MAEWHPEAHHELMLELAGVHNLRVFVETGVYHGLTCAWAAQHFEQVHSIELNPAFIEIALGRLRAMRLSDKVTFYQGDSGELLSTVLVKVAQPALLFLDAHWSHNVGYAVPATGECPLVAEMEAVITDWFPHVVVIHDASYFLGEKPHDRQWPYAAQIQSIAESGGYTMVHHPKPVNSFVMEWNG